MPEYVYQPYPAWRFHPTLPAKVVTEAEDAALDEDWVDSPSKLPAATPAEPESEASDDATSKTPRPRKSK